jgi:pSer/pThr/pTyr-binding forkhead associated (FHA) protein
MTILRLPASTESESAVSSIPRTGWLPAVVCPHGHRNPPESQRCRVCAADLSGAPKQWVERPVIGQLHFDGPPGTIPVTGPMVIGRAPRVDAVSGDDVPTMVTVPGADGDISRSHVRIAVEGWHVLLVDLNATNGTVVTDPNGTSRRLRPGEEKMILPGSRIVLADTIGFAFEVHG